ncbi:MAG: Sir2 family NAD-dependent protein deacetylase [Balneolaceae bacterium]
MNHVVVLTGAGISADSGLATFRDSGGLWEGFDVNEVASIEGWHNNKEKVLQFYNRRREQAHQAVPNRAHVSIADLEKNFEVTVVTQNVDDLHERAGSTQVVHLHGLLRQARSELNPGLVTDIGAKPIFVGDKAEDGAQLRPNIVWFGEPVPMIEQAVSVVNKADLFMVVGTSLAVYPAAGLVNYLNPAIPKYIVDPSTPELHTFSGWTHIKEKAASGVPNLIKEILKNI